MLGPFPSGSSAASSNDWFGQTLSDDVSERISEDVEAGYRGGKDAEQEPGSERRALEDGPDADDREQADHGRHDPQSDAPAEVRRRDTDAVDGQRDGRNAPDVEQDRGRDPALDGLDLHRTDVTLPSYPPPGAGTRRPGFACGRARLIGVVHLQHRSSTST